MGTGSQWETGPWSPDWRPEAVCRFDHQAAERASARLDDLTKPPGSLGTLEQLAIRLAGITGRMLPGLRRPGVLIYAADHGVAEEGVSAYDAEVTEQMAVNICMGSAVSSVLARAAGAVLKLVDVGIVRTVRHPAVVVRKVRPGTANFTKGPAMSVDEARQAVRVGWETTMALIDDGVDHIAFGELGIANTTASAALLSRLLSLPAEYTVGRGTGVDDAGLERKRSAVRRALQANFDARGPWEVLAALGGLEIAALAGGILACATRRTPVILDGVVVSAAALWASRIAPNVRDVLVAAHASPEPAHRIVLDALGLKPLFDWGMRLGEASGALVALPLVAQACRVIEETATFADARVTNPHRKMEASQPQEDKSASSEELRPGDAGSGVCPPVPVDFTEDERRAVYKAIYARRDIRVFLPDPIPDEVLARILDAAHHAPSVGFMQPWNFIVIRDKSVLRQLHAVVERERVRAGQAYEGLRRDFYLRLKVEGLLQAPVTVCVTNDPTRGGPHVLGRFTIPETDLMSTACAIENMWLAARAEGIAMGWVSIFEKKDVRDILGIPEPVEPVALLSLGWTPHFPDIPVLERVGWRERLALSDLVYVDRWGQRMREEGAS